MKNRPFEKTSKSGFSSFVNNLHFEIRTSSKIAQAWQGGKYFYKHDMHDGEGNLRNSSKNYSGLKWLSHS